MAKTKDAEREELLRIYDLLLDRFGHLGWWPADSPFEVMVGAILTQNTAWSNVEKAVAALKKEGLLSPPKLLKADLRKLKRLIRPSGYYNQKAIKLKDFTRFYMKEYAGSLKRMANRDVETLREKLLAVRGVGPETADSILLYALEKPVFVVDAYTRRAFARLGYLPPGVDYETAREFFTRHLPRDVPLYNDFHAQIVYLGKDYCKTRPLCEECPLRPLNRCSMLD
jgi:endonuclease-3 related protein